MTLIMVIEDAAIVREPLDAALKRAGYETFIACNGADAVALIEAPHCVPDLILLDLAMPVMDGLSFLRRLRADTRTRDVPVLVLTAVAEREQVVQAAKIGISGYLLKSRFSLSELLEQVAKHASRSEERPGADGATSVHRGAEHAATRQADPSGIEQAKMHETVSHQASVSSPNAQVQVPVDQLVSGDDSCEVLKSLKPLLSRSEIAERIDSCAELKGLSPAATKILKLTGNSQCSIEQVAKAISQDHAIALKVLKLANSAVYTRGEPVDSVQLAVSRIGLGQIRQTVLNLAVIDQFSSGDSGSSIHPGQFWEHGIATGIIAAEITRHHNEKEVDSAFTMGLLHDVGRLFLADQFGETYTQVLDLARQAQIPFEQVESRLLLYNHADVMDRVLHSWKFPKQLINPIVFHHLSAGNIRRSAPRQIEEVATLAIANRLAHAMMLGSSGNEAIYPTEELCEMLRLDPQVIMDIHAMARDETDKMKFALLAGSSAANWPELRQVHREAIGGPFRPLYVSLTLHHDACRIFCEELAPGIESDNEADEGGESRQSPNIGILHISNTRDRVAATSAYREAERDAGVSGLPLIAISPAGKVLPENSMLAGRSFEVLSTPFVISRFIAAVRNLLGGRVAKAAA